MSAEEQALEIEWTRQFGTSSYDNECGVAAGPQGEVYVAGWTRGALPGQTFAGEDDVFLRKYDPDGNEVWTRQFGTSGYDNAWCVAARAHDFAEIDEEISMLLNEGYSIEDAVEEVVNSIDSDGDGLVDGKKIEIGTNPLNVDSDGDMWNDAADMSPTNAIIPNVFIAGVVAAVVVAVFLLLRER